MNTDDPDANKTCLALINGEGQYSIWPKGKRIPGGWRATGFEGDEQTVVAHIDEVWVDMRPVSLRERTSASGASPSNHEL